MGSSAGMLTKSELAGDVCVWMDWMYCGSSLNTCSSAGLMDARFSSSCREDEDRQISARHGGKGFPPFFLMRFQSSFTEKEVS